MINRLSLGESEPLEIGQDGFDGSVALVLARSLLAQPFGQVAGGQAVAGIEEQAKDLAGVGREQVRASGYAAANDDFAFQLLPGEIIC